MSVTLILIVITIIASFFAWKNVSFLEKWMFNPFKVYHDKQLHRFVTSGFIHNDYIHLFFNMFTFYFFGESVEQTYQVIFNENGKWYFLFLYLAGMIISDIPSLIKHKDQPQYNSLGASGGVAAVVFSSILFYPTNNIYIMAILPVPGFVLGILFLIYSYYQGKKMAGNVNHDAHFFGAVFGILFTIITVPDVLGHFIDELSQFNIF
ncbi:MAG: rhomboid family intramembrane serine protease [Candidatus Cyclobacteriaceae bacterium M3_2C_046]